MEIGVIIFGIIALAGMFLSYKVGQLGFKLTEKEKKEDKKEEQVEKEEENKKEPDSGTALVATSDKSKNFQAEFVKALELTGAKMQKADWAKNDTIVFEYEGETFVAYTYENSCRIDMFDYGWDKVDCEQIEEFAQYRTAINSVNRVACVAVYYEISNKDDAKKYASINSQRELFFWGITKDSKDYLGCILNSFFEAKQKFVEFLGKKETMPF